MMLDRFMEGDCRKTKQLFTLMIRSVSILFSQDLFVLYKDCLGCDVNRFHGYRLERVDGRITRSTGHVE